MITTVSLRDIRDVTDLISDQPYDAHIRRMRSSYLYRGLPNAEFRLTTSLRINCKDKSDELEPSILRNFTKYASIEDPTLKDSVWKQMIIGQHHGLPTRLLDWTRSPLIALHFANSVSAWDKLGRRDCVVWRIDMTEINQLLPEAYANRLGSSSVFTVESLTSVADSLEKYDRDMNGDAFVNLEPPSVDQRIVNQYSFFSVIPKGIRDIEEFLDLHTERTVRYLVPGRLRWDVRDLLDQLNISERILYPGLDGLSRTLARHYFVK
ncbi:MAG: FRG domain-containing protein [Clostridia bacterium]|nr:FRG domain-containing protein [Clostridia bacterium]